MIWKFNFDFKYTGDEIYFVFFCINNVLVIYLFTIYEKKIMVNKFNDLQFSKKLLKTHFLFYLDEIKNGVFNYCVNLPNNNHFTRTYSNVYRGVKQRCMLCIYYSVRKKLICRDTAFLRDSRLWGLARRPTSCILKDSLRIC